MPSLNLRAGVLAALLALAAAPAAARAQAGVVTGTVVESPSGRPLAAATVTLRSAADSTRAAGGTTDAAGRFRISGVAPGQYALQVTLLGYSPLRRAGVAVAAGGADLGTLQLASATLLLEEITVETQASTTIVAPDRNIYSTRDMPVAAGGMATDVLRSVPELEVDINGGVQLRGTAAQIHINGRPAPMTGESLQLFLQQFPADRIDRIEVIANPSARYEAEGAGGIVNVVLKENVDLGLSGSLFANAGSRGEVGSGGRLTYQRGRWTMFGGGFLRRSDRTTNNYDLRQNLLTTPVTLLEQDASSDMTGWSGNVDFTAEFQLDPRSSLRGEASVWSNRSDVDGVTRYTEMDILENPLELYDRAALNESRRLSTDLSASFRHSFATTSRRAGGDEGGAGGGRPGGPGGPGGGPGGFRGGGGGPGGFGGPGGGGGGAGLGEHELSLTAEYESGNQDNWSRVRREYLDTFGDPAQLPIELRLDDNAEGEREVQLSADYVRPWGGQGGRLELGYRAEVRDTDEDRVLEIFADEDEAVAAVTTVTGFGYRENLHSAYGTASRTLGDFSVQAGLRAEMVDTRLALDETDDTYENRYFSLFPSANLRYDMGGGREVRLSYSRRVRRPQPGVLNPINRSNDPLNRSVGNPDIDPQYTNSLSLETSWTSTFGSLRFSPYWRKTTDDWTQIKTVDAQGVSTVTWQNLASVESYGTSLTASIRPIGGVSGNVSVSGSREMRDASNLAIDYSGDYMRWSARGNVSARVTESLAVQGMGYYTPARDVPQGRISSSLMTHFGLRQQFLRGRATLNLMVTDPFDLYRSSFETRDPSHVQIGRSRFSARAATLSFSYAFGRPPSDRRDNEEEQSEEPGIR